MYIHTYIKLFMYTDIYIHCYLLVFVKFFQELLFSPWKSVSTLFRREFYAVWILFYSQKGIFQMSEKWE